MAILATRRERSPNTPEGWTLIDSGLAHEKEATLAVWYRLADGTELTSHTLSWLWGESQAVGAILRYGDINPTAPIGAIATSTGIGNAPVSPGIKVTDAGTRILYIYAVGDGDRVISAPEDTEDRFPEPAGEARASREERPTHC